MTDAFRDRLRRMRLEPEGAAPAPRAHSVRDVLARRRPADTRASTGDAASASGSPAGLVEVRVPEGRVVVRPNRFASEHRHGSYRLDEVRAIDAEDVALLALDPAFAGIDFSRALYFDTETTGLSGGAGTYVFLVGMGTFEGGEFRLWQGFLEHPAEERALLAEVARRMRDACAIVSFFGKSFDRHRLEDRMRVHGIDPPFGRAIHLDLFHPLQRLYRGALDDTRLATLEGALCGVERDGDLSGALAPAAWFDFLAGRPHALEGVLAHNQDDVLSLVTLLAHLGRARREERADGAPLAGPAAARAHGIGRILSRAKRHGDAAEWFARACDLADSSASARRMRWAQASALAKSGASAGALELVCAMTEEDEDECTAHAWSLRAQLCERHLHDARASIDACERALAAAARWHTGAELARLERACLARRKRLARSLGISGSDSGARA